MSKLKKIVIHWTGGSNNACADDLAAYHFVVTGTGEIVRGTHKPESNINCYDGDYAKHAGGYNTGAIGIAACGMYGSESWKKKPGNYPLNRKQMESLFHKVAQLCKQYDIPISEVRTHYEVGKMIPNSDSGGKPDIDFLSYEPNLPADKIGDYIRSKCRWYLERL